MRLIENRTGQPGTIGVGLPGSVDPRTGIAKGASSTWLNGRPVEQDLREALGRDIRAENDADCLAASEAIDGAGARLQRRVRGHPRQRRRRGHRRRRAGASRPQQQRRRMGPQSAALPDVTEIPGAPAIAASTAASRPGCPAAASRGTIAATPR